MTGTEFILSSTSRLLRDGTPVTHEETLYIGAISGRKRIAISLCVHNEFYMEIVPLGYFNSEDAAKTAIDAIKKLSRR